MKKISFVLVVGSAFLVIYAGAKGYNLLTGEPMVRQVLCIHPAVMGGQMPFPLSDDITINENGVLAKKREGGGYAYLTGAQCEVITNKKAFK